MPAQPTKPRVNPCASVAQVRADAQRSGQSVACDVVVVGGGAAGVAAAVAAGRAGARVVLLERYGFLGGLATASQVGTVCGLYLRDTLHPEPRLAAGGFVREFASRLLCQTGMEPLRLHSGLWALPFRVTVFGHLVDAFLKECANVTVALHTTVAGVETEGSRVVEVRALAWNQPLLVRLAAVVDCTGEATAAFLAGAAVEEALADQAPALVFSLEPVDASLTEYGFMELRRALREAVETGRLPRACERLSVMPSTGREPRLDLKLNLPTDNLRRPDWRQVTCWEREARDLVVELHRFVVQHVAGCRGARLAAVAPQLGLRSGRRVEGRAKLTDEDSLGCRKHAQGVARGCWPMERWGDKPRPEMTFFDERDYYEVPLDCLRPASLDNLFVAGRCFSAAAGAMSSARVIGTALATGWAAGAAAAFQALGRPLDQAVQMIRQQWNQ